MSWNVATNFEKIVNAGVLAALGACFRGELCNIFVSHVNTIIGPKALHKKVLKEFSHQAQIFRKKTGRCAVLVIDNTELLSSQNPKLLKFLQDIAHEAANNQHFNTVFVAEGQVPPQMIGKFFSYSRASPRPVNPSIHRIRFRVRMGQRAVPRRTYGKSGHPSVCLGDYQGRAGEDCRPLGLKNLPGSSRWRVGPTGNWLGLRVPSWGY